MSAQGNGLGNEMVSMEGVCEEGRAHVLLGVEGVREGVMGLGWGRYTSEAASTCIDGRAYCFGGGKSVCFICVCTCVYAQLVHESNSSACLFNERASM